MSIHFWKMHGAGNDFVLVDDRARTFPADDKAWIASISARRTGVGSEGTILIQPSDKADFRMRFFNPDGGEVDMCGNGARCVARLAHEIGAAPAEMTFETPAGLVGATLLGERVRLRMPKPKGLRLSQRLELDGRAMTYHFVNSGVPHAVIEVDDLKETDVARLGAGIRHHSAFAPAGTNVNFVTVDRPQSLSVRTYERGVEAETMACGTGVVATGLIAGRLGWVTPPVSIRCASGDTLEVDYRSEGDEFDGVTLTGPAAHVFEGTLDYRS